MCATRHGPDTAVTVGHIASMSGLTKANSTLPEISSKGCWICFLCVRASVNALLFSCLLLQISCVKREERPDFKSLKCPYSLTHSLSHSLSPSPCLPLSLSAASLSCGNDKQAEQRHPLVARRALPQEEENADERDDWLLSARTFIQVTPDTKTA